MNEWNRHFRARSEPGADPWPGPPEADPRPWAGPPPPPPPPGPASGFRGRGPLHEPPHILILTKLGEIHQDVGSIAEQLRAALAVFSARIAEIESALAALSPERGVVPDEPGDH